MSPLFIAELALEPPGRSFETAHEAAYWLAEQLGTEGSADFAAGRASWTKEEIDDALLRTADGRAFGGTAPMTKNEQRPSAKREDATSNT